MKAKALQKISQEKVDRPDDRKEMREEKRLQSS